VTAAPLPEDGDWQHVGEQLQQRRVQLDRRWRNRTIFADEAALNYKMVQDIETHARTNFEIPTRADIELAYCLMPGNIRRMLDGGPLEPDPEAERRLRVRQNLQAAAPDVIGDTDDPLQDEGNGEGA
jgi:hypothetical protein